MTSANQASETRPPSARRRAEMKLLLALLTAALACAGAPACGGANKEPGSTSRASSNVAPTGSTRATTAPSGIPAGSYLKSDRDRDNDNDDKSSPIKTVEKSDTLIPWTYGKEAGRADKRAITALIKRYYAAAAAGDGAKACSMMYVTFAEAVAEDYGQGSAGASYMRQGKTCPAVMALLFKHFHGQLTAELPILEVTRVRLERDHGLAVLSFGTMPERQIPVRRERYAWKIGALLDSELP